jgi:hypothetical protein
MGQLASEGWTDFGAGSPGPASRSSGGVAGAGLRWIGGAVVSVAAVTIAAVLTVVFAATLAVIFVLASALIGLCALALKTRRKKADGGVLIEARKVGHSWVAYGWDQRQT